MSCKRFFLDFGLWATLFTGNATFTSGNTDGQISSSETKNIKDRI